MYVYVYILFFVCISTCLIYRDRKERLSNDIVEEFGSLNHSLTLPDLTPVWLLCVEWRDHELMEPELNRQCKCGTTDSNDDLQYAD